MEKPLEQTLNQILERHPNTPTSPKPLHQCFKCKEEFERESITRDFIDNKLVYFCYDCEDKLESEKRGKNIGNLMIKSGIPSKFINLVSDRDITNVLNRGLYIWGKVGTGKTVMACSIARRKIIDWDDKITFYSCPKLIIHLQNSCGKESEENVENILKKITTQEIIILDDIGAEKLTDFARQCYYYIINEREQWQRETIITSNYSLDELDRHIDTRISSRIAGMCDIIELTGKDRRVHKNIP